MSAIASLRYLGNGTWLYRGEQGSAIVTAIDQPALNVIVREGGYAVAEVSARIVNGALTIEEVRNVTVTAATGSVENTLEDGSRFALGFMAGMVVANPIAGLAAGLVYGGIINSLDSNPNANLDYAHEFNFEGSPYHQESNLLNPPQEISVDISRDLRDLFNRSKIAYTNGIGPDGLPWGTATEVAPNATATWGLSPQPGYATLTTEVSNGSGSVTRITQTVERQTGEIQPTYVHEDGQLVATTDHTHGHTWVINWATGEMEANGAPARGQTEHLAKVLRRLRGLHPLPLSPLRQITRSP